MIRPYSISLPEIIKKAAVERAEKLHKNFSEHIKDLLIKDLDESKK